MLCLWHLRLVFTNDRVGVGVVVGVIRELKTEWKSKIGVVRIGRIRTFSFLPIPFTTPSLMIQWKLGCRSWKQKQKNQPIAKSGIEHCHWFILPLLLATPTMQRRRQKQNQCSASDSVGLVFTRSYRSTLLITTLTTTLSLVKTSLNNWFRPTNSKIYEINVSRKLHVEGGVRGGGGTKTAKPHRNTLKNRKPHWIFSRMLKPSVQRGLLFESWCDNNGVTGLRNSNLRVIAAKEFWSAPFL